VKRIRALTLAVAGIALVLLPVLIRLPNRPAPRPSAVPVSDAIRAAVLESTVLLQLGIGGGNGQDCARDYDRQNCSLAFPFGLGTLLSDHLILTHDHLQVIGDDAGTLAELRHYEWLKISGANGREIIVPSTEVTYAPESAPFGIFVLQLPARINLGELGTPARAQRTLTHADYLTTTVYYPTLTVALDTLYPYTSTQLWAGLTVGAAETGYATVHAARAFYATRHLAPRRPLLNGDCGGGSFAVVDGAVMLVGTQSYATNNGYLYSPLRQ
jgi:hypothetical protein